MKPSADSLIFLVLSSFPISWNSRPLFAGVRLPVGLFTLCNWAGDMAPFLKCGLRVSSMSEFFERPTNNFSLPSPDKMACDRFGPGVDVLRLMPMGLSGHVSELLALANACYPDLVELVANRPNEYGMNHFGSSCGYRDESNSCTHNELLHGTLPSPLILPKKLRKLSLVATYITGKLPAASDIAQLDYFNVDNTTIGMPMPTFFSYSWQKKLTSLFFCIPFCIHIQTDQFQKIGPDT